MFSAPKEIYNTSEQVEDSSTEIEQSATVDEKHITTEVTIAEQAENLTKPKEDTTELEENISVDSETSGLHNESTVSEVANRDNVGTEDTGSSHDGEQVTRDNPENKETTRSH